VTQSFPLSEFSAIRALLENVRHAHYRLIWVAGVSAVTRSHFLTQFSKAFPCPLLNIGQELSSSLIEQAAPLRSASAEGAFYDLLHFSESELLCLDRLEILFDESLMLKAVDLVKNASRRFVLLASWPGAADESSLTFGPADHPSYFRIPLSDLECPVYTLPNS